MNSVVGGGLLRCAFRAKVDAAPFRIWANIGNTGRDVEASAEAAELCSRSIPQTRHANASAMGCETAVRQL